jgi:hypothetical protein
VFSSDRVTREHFQHVTIAEVDPQGACVADVYSTDHEAACIRE